MYLNFAEREFEAEEIAERLELIATREGELATMADSELRFHSGPPI
jgi:tRNA isopentenyl-2-thiomethyl-A-37 hydroxylase MiaE